MAAAVAVLLVLPIMAADGKKEISDDATNLFSAAVFGSIGDIETEASGKTGSAAGTIDTDDVLYIDEATVTPEDTRVGTKLFVSNQAAAFDTVLVTYKDDDGNESGKDTIEVEIKSSNKEKVKLTLLRGTETADEWQGTFTVTETGTTTKTATGSGVLQSDHGNTLTLTAPDSTIITMEVDGEGPEVTEVEPEQESIGDDDKVTYEATITDADSGLRNDSEALDEPSTSSDGDSDGLEAGEPLAKAGGFSVDIDINLDLGTKTATPADDGTDDQSNLASFAWDDAPADGFSFEFEKADHGDAEHFWNIVARDRVGNETSTDVDEDDDTETNFRFTVDADKPAIDTAQTGIGFDEDDRKEKVNTNAIKLVFVNKDGGDAEQLEHDTIDATDFVVEDNTVVNVIHPNEKIEEGDKDLASKKFDTRNVVYLILENELDPDEEPEVQMLGGALDDIAGNDNANQSIDADDTIAPSLTVTVTGLDEDGDPNGVAGRPVTQDEFTVRVESDEDLNTAPKVFFATLKYGESGGGSKTTDEAKQAILTSQGGGSMNRPDKSKNVWEETFDESADIPGSSSVLFAVIVTAEDDSDQHNRGGSDGYKGKLKPSRIDGGLTSGAFAGQTPPVPTDGEELDILKLEKRGLLVEFDKDIDTVEFDGEDGILLPNTGEVDETESRNPFITILFDENKEFTVDDFDGGGAKDKLEDDDDIEIDSHETVTITALTLDDEDILDRLERVDDEEFSVSLIDMEEGDYELLYSAVDEVGNEIENVKFEFEVLGRSDFKLALRPGWNLISLPGTPAEPGLDDVLPDKLRASRVLQWVDGAFEVNERQGDGTWDPSGGVTELVAGPGYWVFTTAFEDIKTLIPERNPATVLPTVEVRGGWNLIGAVSLTEPPEKTGSIIANADDYLVSLDGEFSIVYGFDTQGNAWTKLDNDAGVGEAPACDKDKDNCFEVGKGYWVWASKAGTIVP